MTEIRFERSYLKELTFALDACRSRPDKYDPKKVWKSYQNYLNACSDAQAVFYEKDTDSYVILTPPKE
jgi:hypothetical protein